MRDKPSAEELEALGEQIAEQAVHLDAAMHRLLTDLRSFDEAGGWHVQGFSSCAHWLSYRVGWDLGTSRERVRVAKALSGLPMVEAALAAGTLSYSKARAITRVATPVTEPTLLQYAELSTASQLETICRKFQAAERVEANPKELLPRDDERYVVTVNTALGAVCVKAFLRPDEAALFMQVIQQAAKACVGEEGEAPRSFNRADGLMAVIQAYARGDSAQRSPIEMIVTTPAETLRAKGGLSSTFVAGAADSDPESEIPAEASRAAEHALEPFAEASPAADHEAELPVEAPAQASVAYPHDRGASIPVAIVAETSAYLSPETARRLACDCGLVQATVDPQGQPLSVGRKTRTVPAAIKRALLLRDRTCRFPGCDHRLFLDSHHLKHWADGGETSLENLAILCTLCRARHKVHYAAYAFIPRRALRSTRKSVGYAA